MPNAAQHLASRSLIGALLGTQTAAQGPDSRWLALVYPLSDEQTRTEDFPMLLTLSSDGAVHEHREMQLDKPRPHEDPSPQIDWGPTAGQVVVRWPDKARSYVQLPQPASF